MHLKFLGAAKTVTGSSFLLTTDRLRILVDCGMFQGTKELRQRNFTDFPYAPQDLDFLLLTHAHIDHSGLIPKLCKNGFKGKIITTKATADLCKVMLPDSGHIQEMETEWDNRKRRRAGLELFEPLYTAEEAAECLKFFETVNYNQVVKLDEDLTVCFRDAGHILGSAIIEIWVREGKEAKKIVFSGDLGNSNQPIIRDPSVIEEADFLVMESTYGNRLHEDKDDKLSMLKEIINRTYRDGGNLIIPAFAVERTQDILYDLNLLFKQGLIPPLPVYVDSPLAISATEIFRNNPECFDAETNELLAKGDDPFNFLGLTFTRTMEESKTLNEKVRGAIIISASGMCDAGRIKHHLKHNLWRPESGILFVGYQAEGSLGRRILDGEKRVKILGEEISVKANIYNIDGFSAHADQAGLIDWAKRFKIPPQMIFIVHGEAEASTELSRKLSQELNYRTYIPNWGEEVKLVSEGIEVIRKGITPEELTQLAIKTTLDQFEREYLNLKAKLELVLKKEAGSKKMRSLNQKINELRQKIREFSSGLD